VAQHHCYEWPSTEKKTEELTILNTTYELPLDARCVLLYIGRVNVYHCLVNHRGAHLLSMDLCEAIRHHNPAWCFVRIHAQIYYVLTRNTWVPLFLSRHITICRGRNRLAPSAWKQRMIANHINNMRQRQQIHLGDFALYCALWPLTKWRVPANRYFRHFRQLIRRIRHR